jgi:hypothetical protein
LEICSFNEDKAQASSQLVWRHNTERR